MVIWTAIAYIWLGVGVSGTLLLFLLGEAAAEGQGAKPSRIPAWKVLTTVVVFPLALVAWPLMLVILLFLNSRLPGETDG